MNLHILSTIAHNKWLVMNNHIIEYENESGYTELDKNIVLEDIKSLRSTLDKIELEIRAGSMDQRERGAI